MVGRTNECESDDIKRQQAQVGGRYGYGTRNQRGQKLHYFCNEEGLTIANTQFDKLGDQLWTHRSTKCGGTEIIRQIEYILINLKDKWRLQNIYSSDDLHVGEDHRTLTATIRIDKKYT